MSGSDEYRQNAADCIWLSQGTPDPDRKISLLDMAQFWLRLAEQVEQRARGLLGPISEIVQQPR